MKINNSEIKRITQAAKERIEQAIIQRMQFIGEAFVRDARTNANFQDRTGNLRSSIGYVILKNGLQLFGSDWTMIKQGSEGVIAGQKLIQELSIKFSTGLVLLCVAGMDYASYVEAKGFDVISSSALVADKKFKDSISRLKVKIQSGKF